MRQLQQQYSTAQIREMIRLYTAAYGNTGMNARQVLEEMVCDAMGEMNAFATEETSSVAGEVGQFLRDLRKAALETQTEGQKKNAPEGVKYSLVGINQDGIEVYETSDDVKALSYKERRERFMSIMENEYRGRTAKFTRGGQTYYATFDDADIRKNIYGDKRSDRKGWRAKINTGADGNVFELVENAQFDGSKAEQGKTIESHNDVLNWDYFVKTVQIDGDVFNLLANVRKKADGAFVYSIQLKENRKMTASPPLGPRRASNGVTNTVENTITQQEQNVKQKYSRELELDSEGNALTQEQTDFFADSEVRNDDGELIPVYHKTTESFTVFKRGKLGKETLRDADDASLAATSLIGHWFSDSENTPFIGDAMKTYLNIKNPYYTSLDELAADMGDLSGDLEMMQDHFDRGQYNMVREAARSYVRWMKWKGYDGLIVNDTETGGTSYVILNSNQAKLTDNGNPSTKRDIRYSQELETVEALKRQRDSHMPVIYCAFLLYSVRMLTWAEVSWSMLPSS